MEKGVVGGLLLRFRREENTKQPDLPERNYHTDTTETATHHRCLSVCLSLCLSVCLSSYPFPLACAVWHMQWYGKGRKPTGRDVLIGSFVREHDHRRGAVLVVGAGRRKEGDWGGAHARFNRLLSHFVRSLAWRKEAVFARLPSSGHNRAAAFLLFRRRSYLLFSRGAAPGKMSVESLRLC